MRGTLLSLLGLVCAAACAAPSTITGRVLDAQKAPVAGAGVWVAVSAVEDVQPHTLASTRSGEDGAFCIADIDLAAAGDVRSVLVLAFSEGRALGWETFRPPLTAAQSVDLVCAAPVPIDGRLVDDKGAGVSARLEPRHVIAPEVGTGRVARHSADLPSEVRELLTVQTGADGRYTLGYCAEGSTASVRADCERFGPISLYTAADKRDDIVIRPPGSIRVRVSCPGAPEAAAGVRLTAHGADETMSSSWSVDAVTGADGTAVLGPLQPGSTMVWQEAGYDAAWRLVGQRVEVRSGEVTPLEARLQPTLTVTGRVLDAGTGKPLAGVTVWGTPPASVGQLAPPPTGRDGAYSLHVLPGALMVYVASCPDGYDAGDGPPNAVTADISTKLCTMPDLSVARPDAGWGRGRYQGPPGVGSAGLPLVVGVCRPRAEWERRCLPYPRRSRRTRGR